MRFCSQSILLSCVSVLGVLWPHSAATRSGHRAASRCQPPNSVGRVGSEVRERRRVPRRVWGRGRGWGVETIFGKRWAAPQQHSRSLHEVRGCPLTQGTGGRGQGPRALSVGQSWDPDSYREPRAGSSGDNSLPGLRRPVPGNSRVGGLLLTSKVILCGTSSSTSLQETCDKKDLSSQKVPPQVTWVPAQHHQPGHGGELPILPFPLGLGIRGLGAQSSVPRGLLEATVPVCAGCGDR